MWGEKEFNSMMIWTVDEVVKDFKLKHNNCGCVPHIALEIKDGHLKVSAKNYDYCE